MGSFETSPDPMLERRAWGWVLFVHSRILAALEDDMLSQHDLSLTWLDILDRLRQSPGQRMRMNELEQASLFTRSGLTRLIDKMEQAGLVQRERVPDDRRGIYVTITAAGHEKVSRVWPDLGASIHEHFGRHLDQDDAHAIIRALSKVLPEGEGPLVSPPAKTDHRSSAS